MNSNGKWMTTAVEILAYAGIATPEPQSDSAPPLTQMTLYIYAAYARGRCVYVGLTQNPKRRYSALCSAHPTLKHIRGLKFRILRTTDRTSGPKIEAQIIRAYQRRGEASQNKADYAMPIGALGAINIRVTCVETGEQFNSVSEAARAIGVTGWAITISMRRGYGVRYRNERRSFVFTDPPQPPPKLAANSERSES